jgi:hypothetical protein
MSTEKFDEMMRMFFDAQTLAHQQCGILSGGRRRGASDVPLTGG